MNFCKVVSAVLPVAALCFVSCQTEAKETSMIFPEANWTTATPQSQGIDDVKLHLAIENLRRNVGKDGVRELLIVHNGRVIWEGDDVDKVHGIWSATKSFTSTVLGLLIEERKAKLDSRAAEFAPELAAHYPEVTLRHFATMTSGYRAIGDEPQGDYKHGPSSTPFNPNPTPLFKPPGSHFAYWDSAMNEFAHVLTRIAGERLYVYFKQHIADPIGMNPAQWKWGEVGREKGFSINGGAGNMGKHIQISASEMARFGHLFLNRGRWNGKQLISEQWVDEATRVQVPATMPLGHESFEGPGVYGFNWWVNGTKSNGERKWPGSPPRTFAASGFNNNKCFVIPEWNMVVVRLGLDGNVSDEVWSRFFEELQQSMVIQK